MTTRLRLVPITIPSLMAVIWFRAHGSAISTHSPMTNRLFPPAHLQGGKTVRISQCVLTEGVCVATDGMVYFSEITFSHVARDEKGAN